MMADGSSTSWDQKTASGTDLLLDEAAVELQDLHGAALNDMFVERLIIGVFFVGIKLSDGSGGVAYTPPEVVRTAGRCILRAPAPFIRGMPVREVMAGHAPGPFAGVIRLAALNALSVPFFCGNRYTVDTSGDLSGIPAIFRGRRVCMVGAIIPLLKRLQELKTSETLIIDRKKETWEEAEAGYGRFIAPDRTEEALSHCQTAVFTGAAIANGTIARLINLVPESAAIAVVGPTAGFIPDPIFRRRVALVGTALVTDIDQALDILAEGGGAYRLFGCCVKKINLLNLPRLQQLGLATSKAGPD